MMDVAQTCVRQNESENETDLCIHDEYLTMPGDLDIDQNESENETDLCIHDEYLTMPGDLNIDQKASSHTPEPNGEQHTY